MGLLSSIFSRNDAAAEGVAVEQARTRARRRLIGAAVLVGIGVIGFPLLFETQPRPIPVDVPIEIPRRDAVAPLTLPASAAARDEVVTGTKADAGRDVAAPEQPASAPAAPAPKVAAAPAKPVATPKSDKPVVAANDAGRVVVQIGAFADAAAAGTARQRVEKLGLKTYTQVVDTQAGQRIRVRVGPFASRDEADRAAGRIRSAGLQARVLAP